MTVRVTFLVIEQHFASRTTALTVAVAVGGAPRNVDLLVEQLTKVEAAKAEVRLL